MDDKQIEGGAGPALAAHSKDASAPGSPASSATAQPGVEPSLAGSISDTVSELAGQARGAAEKVASSVSTMAGQAREQLAERGVTTEQVSDFVQEKPLIALLAAGGVGMILGILLSSRR